MKLVVVLLQKKSRGWVQVHMELMFLLLFFIFWVQVYMKLIVLLFCKTKNGSVS